MINHFRFSEKVPRPPWKISTKSPRILEREHVGLLGNTPRSEMKIDGNKDDVYKTNKHYRSKSVPATLTNSSKSKFGPPLSVLRLIFILFA